jgi:hypothetical protein
MDAILQSIKALIDPMHRSFMILLAMVPNLPVTEGWFMMSGRLSPDPSGSLLAR